MSDKERNFTCDLHCKGAVTPMCAQAEAHVPIHLKMTLTIKEAAEYSSIGINKIDALLKQPNCPFVLFVGTRKLVKQSPYAIICNCVGLFLKIRKESDYGQKSQR